jgi:MFS family permease
LATARFLASAAFDSVFFVGLWGKAAYQFDSSPGELALLMAVLNGTWLAGAGVSGLMIDRLNPKRVIVLAEVTLIPISLGLVVADSMTQLVLTAGLYALVAAPSSTAVASIGPYVVAKSESLRTVNVTLETAGQIGFIAGTALAAVVVRFLSLDWVFGVAAVASAMSAVLVAGVRVHAPPPEPSAGVWKEFKHGLGFSYSERTVRLLLILSAGQWMAFTSFETLEPLFFRDVLGSGPEIIGWMNMVLGVGLVLGSLLVGRFPRRAVSVRTLTATIGVMGLGLVLLVATSNTWFVGAGFFVTGAAMGVVAPILRTVVQTNVPRRLVGRVTATLEVHDSIGELIPLTFVAALAVAMGVQGAIMAGGLLLVVLAVSAFRESGIVDRPTAPVFRVEPGSPRPITKAP